jgi:competence protein ComEA
VPSAGKRVNINTAGSAELQMLPGIGPALAQRILEDREKHGAYATVEQLDRVRGIGPKTIEKLRAMATVEGEGGVGTGEGQR